MKRDIEHVVTSTAMFVIAFLVSSASQPVKTAPRRRRGPGAPGLVLVVGIALLLGALVWTTSTYLQHVAFCAHFKLQGATLPPLRPGTPPPPSLEYADLTALGIEAVLLTALVFFAIRAVRKRRQLAR